MRIVGRPLHPLLARELNERLRTRRVAMVIIAYLTVLVVVLLVVYLVLLSELAHPHAASYPVAALLYSALLGRSVFETLLLSMVLLVAFIVPGLTAGALTSEGERETLVSPALMVAPRSILFCKLISSLCFVSLLVVAALPLLGVSFVLGGVGIGELARGVVGVLATGAVLACMALACSSFARKTRTAMVLAYGVAVFLIFVTSFLSAALAEIADAPESSPELFTLNPLFAVADVTARAEPIDTTEFFLPLESLRQYIYGTPSASELDGYIDAVSPPALRQSAPDSERRVRFWVASLGVLGGLGGAALVLASERLRVHSLSVRPT
ncbi:MAG TPA: ABC transporter permease subunit [Acidimicrobiales bacterium]|nr:ABC transporter permease subunit [Acidimicrobiales bacterium]